MNTEELKRAILNREFYLIRDDLDSGDESDDESNLTEDSRSESIAKHHDLAEACAELLNEKGPEFYDDCLTILETILDDCDQSLFFGNKTFNFAVITHPRFNENPEKYKQFLTAIKKFNSECEWDYLYYHAIESNEDKIAILLSIAIPDFDYLASTPDPVLRENVCSEILALSCLNINDPRIAILIDRYIVLSEDADYAYQQIVRACANLLHIEGAGFYNECITVIQRIGVDRFFSKFNKEELAYFNNRLITHEVTDESLASYKLLLQQIKAFNQATEWDLLYSQALKYKKERLGILFEIAPPDFDYMEHGSRKVLLQACKYNDPTALQIIRRARDSHADEIRSACILHLRKRGDAYYETFQGLLAELDLEHLFTNSDFQRAIEDQARSSNDASKYKEFLTHLKSLHYPFDWHQIYAAAIRNDVEKIHVLLEIEQPPFIETESSDSLLLLAVKNLTTAYQERYSRHNKYALQHEVPKRKIKILNKLVLALISKTSRFSNYQLESIERASHIISTLNNIKDALDTAPWRGVCNLLKNICKLATDDAHINKQINALSEADRAIFSPEQLNAYYQSIQQKIINQTSEIEVTVEPELNQLSLSLQQAAYVTLPVWKITLSLQEMGYLAEWKIKQRPSLSSRSERMDTRSITYITHPDPRLNGWYNLPKGNSLEIISYQLMTTILYQSKRHAWKDEACLIDRLLLAKVSKNKFPLALKPEELERELVEIETKEHSYFGEEISDDSDEEGIPRYESQMLLTHEALESMAKKLGEYGQTSKMLTLQKSLKKTRDVGYDILRRAEIHHPTPISLGAHHALSRLNKFVLEGRLNEETYKQVGYHFFIAQYRGVHYNTEAWSSAMRRAHRKEDGRKKPIYSRALEASTRSADLKQHALILNHQLQSLRETGRYYDPEKKIWYNNLSDALQDAYTKNYAAYHRMLKQVNSKRKKGDLISSVIEIALLFTENGSNPYVSTANTPYHALRYAYGLKTYPDEMLKYRLRPRWRADGRAERPYSGKVSTMLFTPLDYFTLNPNDVTAMNNNKDLGIHSTIVSERETTYLAFIPEERVIEEYVARYPSFHHPDYSGFMNVRYGLDSTQYQRIKERIVRTEKLTDETYPPHSEKRKTLNYQVGEVLCAQGEPTLIESARSKAAKLGGLLIYRDITGGFSFVPPPDTERAVSAHSEVASVALDARRAELRKKTEARKDPHRETEATSEESLTDIVTDKFRVLSGHDLSDILPRLSHQETATIQTAYSGSDIESIMIPSCLEKWRTNPPDYLAEVFMKRMQQLQNVAIKCNLSIVIKSFLFNSDIVLNPISAAPLEAICLLYLGGDGFFGLVTLGKSPTKSFAEVMGLTVPDDEITVEKKPMASALTQLPLTHSSPSSPMSFPAKIAQTTKVSSTPGLLAYYAPLRSTTASTMPSTSATEPSTPSEATAGTKRKKTLALDNSVKRAKGGESQRIFHQARSTYKAGVPKINGLSYQSIPGDGHCLFHAVGLYAGRDKDSLRNSVADYIQEHLDEFLELILAINPDQSPEEYIAAIRRDEWADNLEIIVLMRILNRPIVIIGPDGKIRKTGDDLDASPGEPIFIYYNGDNHYDALLLADASSIDAREILFSLEGFDIVMNRR